MRCTYGCSSTNGETELGVRVEVSIVDRSQGAQWEVTAASWSPVFPNLERSTHVLIVILKGYVTAECAVSMSRHHLAVSGSGLLFPGRWLCICTIGNSATSMFPATASIMPHCDGITAGWQPPSSNVAFPTSYLSFNNLYRYRKIIHDMSNAA